MLETAREDGFAPQCVVFDEQILRKSLVYAVSASRFKLLDISS